MVQVNETNSSTSMYLKDQKKDPVQTLDKDAFMKLFITQLQYQDPTSPQDTSEFMNQMAQFTMLEQLANINTNLEQMLRLDQMTQASAFIGKEVTVVEGESTVTGIVEKVSIDQDGIKIWFGDMAYLYDNVISIKGGSEKEEIPDEVVSVEGGVNDGSEEQVPPVDTSQQPADNPA